MINIGVVTDISWDNYILIFNKFKKINSENYRLHSIYGKTLELISICANKNLLTLIRHYSDNLSKTIYNMLQICDIWIIFTNQIEYNTTSRLVIEKCKESECEKGFLSREFFDLNINTKYRFSSGPFTDKIFHIIDLQKNRIKILIGNVKTTIKRNQFLFTPA